MPSLFYVWLARFQALFLGRRDDADFSQEMQSHLAMLEEEHLRRGRSPEEARRAARVELGALARLQEERREQRSLPGIESLVADSRYALRTLAKSRTFTAAAVLTLALGIGANSMIFSVVNTIFLKPLPYPDPDRLVNVWRGQVGQPEFRGILSAPNFQDWHGRNHVFENMALFDSAGKGYNLSGEGDAERVRGLRVSSGLFPLLGVPPLMGRTFLPEEETLGQHRVVILSYELWQRRYNGDRQIVGKSVRVDSEAHTVVGVMPAGFGFDFFSGHNELWVPVGFDRGDRERGSNSFGACARLKAGVTIARASAEMDSIGRTLAAEYPNSNGGETVVLTPMSDLGVRNLRPTFIAIFASVGFVLLIACVNVANLLLARGAARSKEFAVRRALGASRLRIVRQLLTESILLAIFGGLAGLAIAAAGLRFLEQVLPVTLRNLPFRDLSRIDLDGRVFVFTFAICCLTGLLFGLAAAVGTLRDKVNDPLKEGRGRGTTARGGRLRHALVAAEVALALGVLTGAALMVQSMFHLWAVNPGLDPRNLLLLSVSLPQQVLYYSAPDRPGFCRDLQQRVGSIPGVVSVGAISHLPISGGQAGRSFSIEGIPDPPGGNRPNGMYALACPNYFATMGIPLLGGRDFSDIDTAEASGAIIINQAMAHLYWQDRNPVGSHIRIGGRDPKVPWLTVVGVVGNVRHNGLDQEPRPQLFRPYPQAGWPVMTVTVRTAAAPGSLTRAVKAGLLTIHPDQASSNVSTMEEVMQLSLGPRRLPTILLASFGLVALVLAAVGIAGVVSFSVSQRTSEIGIRIAMGARPSDVFRLVLGRTMAWTVVGVVAGVGGSALLSRLLTGLLYGVRPMEPAILAIVAVLLLAVALFAGYLPARRATRLDPLAALRYE